MPRRPDFKAGSVLSFRIPENISEEDLEHLSRIAKRSTRGRAGAVSEFFFAKVAEDRIQESRSVTIALPDATDDELNVLDSPMFKRALVLFAYQLLGRSLVSIPNSDGRETHTELAREQEKPNTEFQEGTVFENVRSNTQDIDPKALELLRKLKGT
ncbi:hypothetical protein C7445_1203 [Alicyclobacillus sacchari]|uniref:Uncharacterized protein n=1 Tax=Alicyclobacillus sacchari TaxID=392010 RepID=A0A4V3HDC8_9BACL|nr:hypothetical protein [Alicyclobacillus sacchari]TDY40474.1 hypothetical protein C7445_1203 [Alicyclobacillus sacchari]GMA59429.1 hypothetical protein GCM10025858_39330 [Alicyclobacillus sacchari]